MKNLLRNSLIASVVAVAGATTFAAEANAQSVDVYFSGTIGNACEINKIKDGKLGMADSNGGYLHANPNDSSQGELGEINVNCNGSGQVTLTNLNPISADAQDLASYSLYSQHVILATDDSNTKTSAIAQAFEGYNGYEGLNIDTSANVLDFNGSSKTLYLDMWASDQQDLRDGEYTYRTTVTVTPQ